MRAKFETSVYLGWFSETEHARDQQNSVAYGKRNGLTGASSRFISFKHIFMNLFYYSLWLYGRKPVKIYRQTLNDRQSDVYG